GTLRRRRCRGRGGLGLAHRRYAHLVTRIDAILRLDAPAVDANLAGSQQPIDVGTGNAFEVAQQEIVDALAVVLLAGLDDPGARFITCGWLVHLIIDSVTYRC